MSDPSRESAPAGRAILTYGRGLMTLAAAQSLHNQGVEVIGCDCLELTVLQFSRNCARYFRHADPDRHEARFIEDLIKAVEKYRPPEGTPYVLMPLFRETAVIARHAHRFEGRIVIAAPGQDSIGQVEPKDHLIDTARKAGVHAPHTVKFVSLEAAREGAEALSYPVLTKPVAGVGGRGITKHKSAADLLSYLESLEARPEDWPIVQEAVGGEDYCFCALCKDGEIVVHMAYRNLRGFPKESGSGVLRETVDDAAFLPEARKLLKAVKWDGVCEIDYRWTGKPDDAPCLIEVNARFWAGLYQSLASGVDFPWLLFQLAAFGECETPDPAEIGLKTKVPMLWLISAAQDVADDDEYFEQLRAAWESLAHPEEGESRLKALKRLVGGLFDAHALSGFMKALKEARQPGKGAESDFIHADDPGAALGILFVASSLARTGKLPPEFRFK